MENLIQLLKHEMSRQTKFTLTFRGGALQVKVGLIKSFDAPVGLKSTYGGGRAIRMVKILTKDNAPATCIEDIEMIVPWSDTVPAFPYVDDETGESKLLIMDEKTQCSIFKKSEFMNAMGFIDAAEVTPNMFTGDHYFVNLQKESKAPAPAEGDVQAYSLLFYLLKEHKRMLLINFISGEREKFGVMHAVGDGVMLSVIIHHNYQRSAPKVSRIPLPKAEAHAAKMLSAFSLRRFDPITTSDKYEENIRAYIEQLKEHAKSSDSGGKVKAKMKTVQVQQTNDFFSRLEAL